MADDRRVIFSSYLIGKRASSTEEDIVTKWIMHPDIGKALGGKGIVTDMAAIQGGQTVQMDGWTSMLHENITWNAFDDDWETAWDYWSGILGASGVAIALSGLDVDLSFCYIKNLGSENELFVSLDEGVVYKIIIPPGGSVHFRGNSGLKCNDIYVRTNIGVTNIEFILAEK